MNHLLRVCLNVDAMCISRSGSTCGLSVGVSRSESSSGGRVSRPRKEGHNDRLMQIGTGEYFASR